MQVSLPYGRSFLGGKIPDDARLELVKQKRWVVRESGENVVRQALRRPIESSTLSQLARGKHSVTIVTCDKTRGVPSHITIPLILEELISGGVRKEDVSVLIATGLHKGESVEDVRERFGDSLASDLEILVHDSDNQSELTYLGKLATGNSLYLNNAVLEADLVVVEGAVEPHFFAGFTGGSKIVLPGVAGTETVLGNHCWKNIDHEESRSGNVQNPIRRESDAALRFLKQTFVLNLIQDGTSKRIVDAFAGDPISSFEKAAAVVNSHAMIRVEVGPDIVITTNGGYPLDRNVYQCVKGIAVPEEIVRKNSKIIMISECSDGPAHRDFARILEEGTPSQIYDSLKASKTTVRDQWQVQILCRILLNNDVWFVTRKELKSDVEAMHMNYAATLEDALSSGGLGIRNAEGKRIVVAPEGPSTILKPAY